MSHTWDYMFGPNSLAEKFIEVLIEIEHAIKVCLSRYMNQILINLARTFKVKSYGYGLKLRDKKFPTF